MLAAAHVSCYYPYPALLSLLKLKLGPTGAKNVYIVALGTIIGHMICTAIAVIAGRYVSTRISAKHGTSYFFSSAKSGKT
jgi:hypothetical protein